MIKPILVITSAVLLLTSCVSPEQLEHRYTEIGGKCVSIGKSMSAVEECIGVEFLESTYRDQIVKDHQSCKPCWGFPFVQSCGGIKVIYNQNKVVTKWLAWGQLDGV